jgi:SAM-dependent methyltransferase
MHEILKKLQADSLVLDLGCAEGSFPQNATLAVVVRVDREAPNDRANCTRFVQANAATLPFADQTFAAVISNHSLEHFDDLAGTLREIGRVTRPSGSLFVAVPDTSTLTDKLYRWLARGGGHVNAFTSSSETAAAIEKATGLPHVATRLLCSSLSFLNRRNAPRPVPRRLLLLGAGYEWSLFLYAWLSRQLDRRLNTRSSIYGWAFYFGSIEEPVNTETWVNVCIRCGSGCSASSLKNRRLVRSIFLGFRIFQCPDCGAANPFADDSSGANWLRRETLKRV